MLVKVNGLAVSDIILRVVVWLLFIWMELSEPFHREIQPEEVYLYKYPHRTSFVSNRFLWMICLLAPILTVTGIYLKTRDKIEYTNCLMCITFTLGLNGFLTSLIKVLVGRPRPDFYYRCFPDGDGDDFDECTGNRKTYMDGRKSFPSGHSSFTFASMTLVTLYLIDRYQTCLVRSKRGETWKLCVTMLPLLLATIIAISRTCDYHHHWQDVVVGSLLGSTISYFSYKHHFSNEPITTTNIPLITAEKTMSGEDILH